MFRSCATTNVSLFLMFRITDKLQGSMQVGNGSHLEKLFLNGGHLEKKK